MIKKILLLVSAALFVFGLAACNKAEDTGAEVAAPAEAPAAPAESAAPAEPAAPAEDAAMAPADGAMAPAEDAAMAPAE